MQAQLIITIADDGSLNVQGPIDNKMVAYGMLEVARDAINEHSAKSQRLVQPASGLLPQPH